jgi:hypothetical protein
MLEKNFKIMRKSLFNFFSIHILKLEISGCDITVTNKHVKEYIHTHEYTKQATSSTSAIDSYNQTNPPQMSFARLFIQLYQSRVLLHPRGH